MREAAHPLFGDEEPENDPRNEEMAKLARDYHQALGSCRTNSERRRLTALCEVANRRIWNVRNDWRGYGS